MTNCVNLTDKAVETLSASSGANLLSLNLSGTSVSDRASSLIARDCTNLRSLDLSRCGHITDNTVHSIARGVTSLTTLKLDNIRAVSTKTLMSYIGVLEFVDMASKWVGYKPKANVEGLIRNRELFRLHAAKVLSYR